MLDVNLSGFFQIKKVLIFIQLICLINTYCNYSHPIKVNNECYLTYCTKEEYLLNSCIIDNPIIKDQWLTNIIKIGTNTSRYINFATTDNGDMIVETSTYPGSSERIFYGLKSNGRGFLYDPQTKKEFYFCLFYPNNNMRFESAVSTVKFSNNNNNNDSLYIISFGKGNCFTEIYDFKNHTVYQKLSTDLVGYSPASYYPDIISLNFKESGEEDKYHYLFSTLVLSNGVYYMVFQKYIFYSKDISFSENYERLVEKKYESSNRRVISCFETISFKIVCFYQDKSYYFSIIIFKNDLQKLNAFNIEEELNINENEKDIFFKSIHLKEEAGAFLYFRSVQIYNPIIVFKYYCENGDSLNDYFPSITNITLDKYSFSNNLYLNDLIKISENKICFATVSLDKETLYIIILNIYKINDYIIKAIYKNLFKRHYI